MRRTALRILIVLMVLSFLVIVLAAIMPVVEEDPIESRVLKLKYFKEHAETILKDSVVVIAAGPQYKRSRVFRFFYGDHYRSAWATPVEAPVFNIRRNGGYKLVKKGGSQQTTTLRILSADSLHYVLRTVDKNQKKALPGFWRKTFLGRLFMDQASALNPYGSMVVAPMEEAAGIYHTTPELYYASWDPAYHPFTGDIAGELVFFEEFPDNTWVGHPKYGAPEVILDTDDMLELYFGSGADIDIEMYARARLFDILVGDWDRHSDQWEWAGKKKGERWFFQPIARDRDAVFYKFNDGLLNKISLVIKPKFQTFNKSIEPLKPLIYNGKYLDNLLLPGITREKWQELAFDLQKRISDEVISEATLRFPKEIQPEIPEEIAAHLKTRREELPEMAGKMYRLMQKEVIIVTTDRHETVTITGAPESTWISITDSAGNTYYHMSFDPEFTKNIRIHTLDGNDIFEISGQGSSIRLSLYGGRGEDTFTFSGTSKATIIDQGYNTTIKGGRPSYEDNPSEEDLDYNRTGKRK